jgi:hypothetical protein
MALGVQGSIKDTLFLAGAILAHKWAEAFTLVSNIIIHRVYHSPKQALRRKLS